MADKPQSSVHVTNVFVWAVPLAALGGMLWHRWQSPRLDRPEAQCTIHVQGYGTISKAPDHATIQIGVEATAVSAKTANAECAQTMQTVLAALKAQGVVDRNLQTSYIALSPNIRHAQDGPHHEGYTAVNTLTVTIAQLTTLGEILDIAVQAGGDSIRINNINLGFADTPALREEARIAALADARHQAEIIAREMGLTVGAPLNVQMVPGAQPPPPRMMAMARMASAPPIEVGEMDVATTIEVTFAAKPTN
jgi:uncharacterized protein YggE